jgi:hypothetical protein
MLASFFSLLRSIVSLLFWFNSSFRKTTLLEAATTFLLYSRRESGNYVPRPGKHEDVNHPW